MDNAISNSLIADHFVTPALGWQHDSPRIQEFLEADTGWQELPRVDTDPARKSYVPVRMHNYERPSYEEFLRRGCMQHAPRRSQKYGGTFYAPIREASALRAGGYNVLLLLEGPRVYQQHAPRRVRGELAQALSGDRHAYACWSRMDGSRMPSPAQQSNHNAIYAVQSARGVFYLRQRSYCDRNGWIGSMERVVLVTVEVLDRNTSKPDTLRIHAHPALSYRTDGFQEPLLAEHFGTREEDRIDPRWLPLINEARKGFNASCQEIPADKLEVIECYERKRKARQRRPASDDVRMRPLHERVQGKSTYVDRYGNSVELDENGNSMRVLD